MIANLEDRLVDARGACIRRELGSASRLREIAFLYPRSRLGVDEALLDELFRVELTALFDQWTTAPTFSAGAEYLRVAALSEFAPATLPPAEADVAEALTGWLPLMERECAAERAIDLSSLGIFYDVRGFWPLVSAADGPLAGLQQAFRDLAKRECALSIAAFEAAPTDLEKAIHAEEILGFFELEREGEPLVSGSDFGMDKPHEVYLEHLTEVYYDEIRVAQRIPGKLQADSAG